MFKDWLEKQTARLALLKPVSKKSAEHDYFNSFLKSKYDVENLLDIPLKDASVLIIGCGYKYLDVLLYSQVAKDVFGLDIENIFYKDGFIPLYFSYRNNGNSMFRSLFFALSKRHGMYKNYYKHISNISGCSLNHEDIRVISYDGREIPFEDNKFDIVMSNAVLEHVSGLKEFFIETCRVIRPGGLSYHLYHNYYSFSGGHNPECLCKKQPWGHVRNTNELNPGCFLNKARIGDVKKCFEVVFEVKNIFQVSEDHSKKGVDTTFSYEAEDLLTDSIRKELTDFQDEELLVRSYLLVGNKRN